MATPTSGRGEPLSRIVRGHPGRAFLKLLYFAWQEYERDYARYFASAMVYYTLVSLMPLLILVLGALGLILRWSKLAEAAERQFLQAVDAGFGAPLRDTLGRQLQNLQQGSVIAIVVSLVGLLLTASALFHHLRMTFRAIWRYEPPLVGSPRTALRAAILEKTVAFTMMLAASVLLLAAFLLIAALQWLRTQPWGTPFMRMPLGWLLAIPGPLIFAPLTFALLFRFLPPMRLAWRHVWLAALLCAAVWILGAEVLAFYGTHFGKSLGAYGAIGGLLIIMLWINVIGQTLFFGAEICKLVAARDATVGSG